MTSGCWEPRKESLFSREPESGNGAGAVSYTHLGLAALVRDSGAELVGAGIVIEKGFQVGGDLLRSEGIRLESLAIVESMDEETQTIVFRDDE